LHGIHHGARAGKTFRSPAVPFIPNSPRAFGDVKLACVRTNRALGAWCRDDGRRPDAIDRACRELANGDLGGFIIVDALQGGAGTSTNMNVNEVLTNRALKFFLKPVAAEVTRLMMKAESGKRKAKTNQSLLTSAATIAFAAG